MKVTAEDLDEVKRRIIAGEPLKRIARSYNCTPQRLTQLTGGARKVRLEAGWTTPQSLSPEVIEEIKRKRAAGMSQDSIRKALGLSTAMVRRVLKMEQS